MVGTKSKECNWAARKFRNYATRQKQLFGKDAEQCGGIMDQWEGNRQTKWISSKDNQKFHLAYMFTLAKIGGRFLEGKHQSNPRKLQGFIGTPFTTSGVDRTPRG